MQRVNKIYIIILSLIITACKDIDNMSPDLGYAYYPGSNGSYVIYDATEMIHDDAVSIHDTIHYQLKEKIAGSFVDMQGRLALRVERFKRDSSHHPWTISDVWTAVKNSNYLEKTEENEKFIKLIFPVREGGSWDGNATNTQNEWQYEYIYTDEPDTFNNVNFDSTTRVDQIKLISFLTVYRAYEVYAKNVGLVSKYYKLININNGDSTDVKKGNELYLNYFSHGIE